MVVGWHGYRLSRWQTRIMTQHVGGNFHSACGTMRRPTSCVLRTVVMLRAIGWGHYIEEWPCSDAPTHGVTQSQHSAPLSSVNPVASKAISKWGGHRLQITDHDWYVKLNTHMHKISHKNKNKIWFGLLRFWGFYVFRLKARNREWWRIWNLSILKWCVLLSVRKKIAFWKKFFLGF